MNGFGHRGLFENCVVHGGLLGGHVWIIERRSGRVKQVRIWTNGRFIVLVPQIRNKERGEEERVVGSGMCPANSRREAATSKAWSKTAI